jgi:hypothetical protein
MPNYALDNADIVREAIYRQLQLFAYELWCRALHPLDEMHIKLLPTVRSSFALAQRNA